MYHIIVNPASRSGKGNKVWRQLEPALLQRQVPYQVYFSEKPGDVAKETRRLSALNQKISLIILGGDGTMNEALQGMSPLENFTVGYIPTGSSNDLARSLGIPMNPLLALNLILSDGSVSLLDIGLLRYENIPPCADRLEQTGTSQKRRFIVSCGIGFDAAVCAEAQTSPLKGVLNRLGLGKLTYLGIALKQLMTAPKTSCELWLDQRKKPIRFNKFIFIASMHHRYEGGGFMFCPNADYKDQTFEICAVGNIPKLLILFALPTAFLGKHYFFKGVDAYRAHTVRIRCAAPLWVHTDGEAKTQADHLVLTQHTEKLRIIS